MRPSVSTTWQIFADCQNSPILKEAKVLPRRPPNICKANSFVFCFYHCTAIVVKVVPYSFTIARALRTKPQVICARSREKRLMIDVNTSAKDELSYCSSFRWLNSSCSRRSSFRLQLQWCQMFLLVYGGHIGAHLYFEKTFNICLRDKDEAYLFVSIPMPFNLNTDKPTFNKIKLGWVYIHYKTSETHLFIVIYILPLVLIRFQHTLNDEH